jgi:hypothetical protein
MKKLLLILLVAVLTMVGSSIAQDIVINIPPQAQQPKVDISKIPVLPKPDLAQSEEAFLKNLYDATFLLYAQDAAGDMGTECTATSFLKYQKGYLLVVASHCIEEKYAYFITDDKEIKTFTPVDDAACGNPAQGMDFCVIHVTTEQEFATVPLGVNPTGIGGEPVVSINNPLGMGKMVLRGNLASPAVKRPMTETDKAGHTTSNWYDHLLFQMPGLNHGSSGAALICMNQRAVCGVVVGDIQAKGSTASMAVALPINAIVDQIVKAGVARRDEPAKK